MLAHQAFVAFDNKKDNMLISGSFISGMMLGVEFLWAEKALILDLLIVRVIFAPLPDEE